ncbi:MAG: helix-turn-helix domain-containing protein [Candidatus Paceibacterota bacterium]
MTELRTQWAGCLLDSIFFSLRLLATSLLEIILNKIDREIQQLIKALLSISPSQTIAEIAYESGFNSPSYFTRAFKKRFGILPSDLLG